MIKNEHIPFLVESFQREHGLTVDGIAGKRTLGLLDRMLIDRSKKPEPADPMIEIGRRVMATATSQFNKDVIDLPSVTDLTSRLRCIDIIDDYIRSDRGLGWSFEEKYDGSFKWCGAFAAACWASVGLKFEERKHYWASCYRLDRWGRYLDLEHHKSVLPTDPKRQYLKIDEHSDASTVRSFGPRAGDILLIGKINSYGHHICLVESFDPDSRIFHTIEGNGGGIGPDGKRRIGIVRGRRFLGAKDLTKSHARRLIRPSINDIVRENTP